MREIPFTKILQWTRRHNWLLFWLLPMTSLLLMLLILGAIRIVNQEASRLALDFSTLVAYAQEEEKFLNDINEPHNFSFKTDTNKVTRRLATEEFAQNDRNYFSVPYAHAHMTYSWACSKGSNCDSINTIIPYGIYMSFKFSNFWSASYFPSSPTWLFSQDDRINIRVPVLQQNATDFKLQLDMFNEVTNATRKFISKNNLATCKNVDFDKNNVMWFKDENLPNKLLGILLTKLNVVSSPSGPPTFECLYAVTILDPLKINILERAIHPALESTF